MYSRGVTQRLHSLNSTAMHYTPVQIPDPLLLDLANSCELALIIQLVHSEYSRYRIHLYIIIILYSGKLSREKTLVNFADFANF